MATDKSEPRIGLIVGIGLLSIVTLVGLRVLLQSYFITVTEDEQRAKVFGQPARQVQHLREAEQQQLAGGPMPIDRAVRALGEGARPAGISPQPSTDWGALQGWTQRPVRQGALVQPPAAQSQQTQQTQQNQNQGSGSTAPSHQ